MDVILTSAFGVQANVQMDPNNEYTRHAETLFQVPQVSRLTGKFHLPAECVIHTFRILSLFAVPAWLVSLSAFPSWPGVTFGQ